MAQAWAQSQFWTATGQRRRPPYRAIHNQQKKFSSGSWTRAELNSYRAISSRRGQLLVGRLEYHWIGRRQESRLNKLAEGLTSAKEREECWDSPKWRGQWGQWGQWGQGGQGNWKGVAWLRVIKTNTCLWLVCEGMKEIAVRDVIVVGCIWRKDWEEERVFHTGNLVNFRQLGNNSPIQLLLRLYAYGAVTQHW